MKPSLTDAQKEIIRDLEKHLIKKLQLLLIDHSDTIFRVVGGKDSGAATASISVTLMLKTAEILAFATNIPPEDAGSELTNLIKDLREKYSVTIAGVITARKGTM
jgi:hypothetical protein